MAPPRILVLAPRGRDAAVIGEVLARLGIDARACGSVAILAAALDERTSAVVATEEDLAGPALGALLTWVAGQPSWSDLPFLVLGARAARSAAQSALLESLGNAVLLERPLAAEALATAARAALRARGRQLQVREEVAAREETANLLRELNQELERRVEVRTAELRDSEARFRAYFESFPEALFAVNVTEAGAFAYEEINPETERVLGVRSAEVEGKPPQAFLPAPAGEVAEREFRRCVALGRTHRYSQALTRDGETLMFDVVVTPMRDAAGRPVRLLGVALDVTQERQLEERLRQAQKLEALGQLTGGVAHDFNNLLTAIIGYSELIEKQNNGDTREHAQLIRKAGEQAAALTRQLLAFSRKQLLEPRVLDLNTLVQDMEKLLQRVIGEGIKISIEIKARRARVRADPSQLEQVMLNLGVNGRDAMPGGGTLRIVTEDVALSAEEIAQRGIDVPPGDYAALIVSDTGSGMDDETLSRIFEPFFTTKGPGKGTGLGLATVYGIVKQSGGGITVESRLGEGCTFSIFLPASSSELEVPELPPVQTDNRGSETVLVVEDEEVVRHLICTVLGEAGYNVLCAESPEEGLRFGREQEKPIDLLVTDIVMPDMNGPTLARALVASQPEMRVLFVSGYSDADISDQGVVEPGLTVLQKPFTQESLAGKVREMLDSEVLVEATS